MTSLMIAAVVCAGVAPTIALAQGSAAAGPGEQAPITVTGFPTAREPIPGVTGPSATGRRCLPNAAMGQSREMADYMRAAPYAEGEVRKVDEAAGKLTLRHAGMGCLEMQPMTMVFRVRDPAWLQDLRVGDIVYFRAGRVDGRLAVNALERAPRGSP